MSYRPRIVALAPLLPLVLALMACEGPPGTMPAAPDAAAPDVHAADADRGTSADARASLDGRDAEASPDARPAADDSAPAAGDGQPASACPPATLDMSWMGAYQRDVVARLSGETEIEPGLKLANRGTPNTRAATQRYLEGELRALGLNPQAHSYGTGANVFARLDGTTGGKDQVVLGAHFDTVVRSPGANDNATGVALVLAVGKALGGLACRSRPVLLVFFDEEEIGLVGAKQFARKLMMEGAVVHSVHTADQLGWDTDHDRLMELERPDTGLRALYESAQRALGLAFPLVTTTTTGSDHQAFRPAFPAVGLTEGYRSGDTTPYRHTAMDTFATVDLDYLRSATVLAARTVADLLR